MAIRLEFFNGLVMVEDIQKKYPGGLDKFNLDYKVNESIIWSDGLIVRFGSMHDPFPKEFIDGIPMYGIYGMCDNNYNLPIGLRTDDNLVWDVSKMPEEPEQLDGGRVRQGGFIFENYNIWKWANNKLLETGDASIFKWNKIQPFYG